MSRGHLAALPGGNGVPGQPRPPAAVRITDRHPSRQVPVTHPAIYDWRNDAVEDPISDAIWHALNIVCHHVRVPGAVPREKALEQVEVLARWSQSGAQTWVDPDPTNARGLGRPS